MDKKPTDRARICRAARSIEKQALQLAEEIKHYSPALLGKVLENNSEEQTDISLELENDIDKFLNNR